MNRIQQLYCGASLALYLAVTAATGFVLFAAFLMHLHYEFTKHNPATTESHTEFVAMAESGRPIIVRKTWGRVHRTETWDLHRRPVDLPDKKPATQSAELPATPHESRHWLARLGRDRQMGRLNVSAPAGENWFSVPGGPGDRGFFFQGILADGGQTVGYIGRDGFQESKPGDESRFTFNSPRLHIGPDRFLRFGKSRVLVFDDRRLLSVDLAQRRVAPLIDGPIVSLNWLDRPALGRSRSSKRRLRAIRSTEQVTVLHLGNATLRRFVIPSGYRDRPFRFFAVGNEAWYVIARENAAPAAEGAGTKQFELVRATASGAIQQRHAIALSSTQNRVRETRFPAQSRIATAAVPGTIASVGIACGLLPWVASAGRSDVTFQQALQTSIGDTWWVVVLVVGLSAWLARSAYRRQQRLGERHGPFWAGLVFLLGVPGYVGFRLFRDEPNRTTVPPVEPTGFEVFKQ